MTKKRKIDLEKTNTNGDLSMDILSEVIKKLKTLPEFERNWVIITTKSYFEKDDEEDNEGTTKL